jgi:DNA-binding NarL/FixJ family response regulator
LAIRVVVLSDEPVAVEGLRALLPMEEFDLIAVPAGEKTLDMVTPVRPDVLLLDCDGGFPHALLAELGSAVPGSPILLWTREGSVQMAHQAIQFGVRGILPKTLRPELVVRCLRAVAQGQLWFERGLTQRLFDANTVHLTKREAQLMLLVSLGLSNREIARLLCLSEGTVKFYLSRLFRKMRVSDRFGLALYGLRLFQARSLEKDQLAQALERGLVRSIVLEDEEGGSPTTTDSRGAAGCGKGRWHVLSSGTGEAQACLKQTQRRWRQRVARCLRASIARRRCPGGGCSPRSALMAWRWPF